MPKLAHIIRGNRVKFSHFRNGEFFYQIPVLIDSNHQGEVYATYQFSLTPEDVKGGMLLAEDSAGLFMKYIKRALNENTFQRVN